MLSLFSYEFELFDIMIHNIHILSQIIYYNIASVKSDDFTHNQEYLFNDILYSF